MAAMLLAGIDGINNMVDPTAAGFGPIDEDIFSWTEAKRSTIKRLPTSLGEAMQALATDHAFLTESGVFEEEMIQSWIEAKRKEENDIQLRPHPYEIELYYDL
jgi:glutamine synthetase